MPEVLRIEGWRLTLPAAEDTAPPMAAARSNEACETPARGAEGWCWADWGRMLELLVEGVLRVMLRLEALDDERCCRDEAVEEERCCLVGVG